MNSIESFPELSDLTGNGRRVTEMNPSVVLSAHQSLYDFAQQFAHGKRVMDAGCGTGYGSFQLAQSGAVMVDAVDHDHQAIDHARQNYQHPALRFHQTDLEHLAFQEHIFDFIYCSNVLQQLPDIDRVLTGLHSRLASDGQMIIAVPFISSNEVFSQNLSNPHQLHNLPPRNWLSKINRYFANIEIRRHWLKPGVQPNWSPDSLLTRNDFSVSPEPDNEVLKDYQTISLLILASQPRIQILPVATEITGYPTDWDPQVVAKALNRALTATAASMATCQPARNLPGTNPTDLHFELSRTPQLPAAENPKRFRFPESQLIHRFLDGLRGLEVGAGAHNPFGLRTKNVGLTAELDARDFEFFKNSQINLCGTWAQIDIPAFADDIPVPDSSYDFVISSHVWEHLPNPLAALMEWARVVRSDGYITAIVPKRDAEPTDRDRPITSLSEHIHHYETNAAHPTQAVRGHYSVFSPQSLREIAEWYNSQNSMNQLIEVAFLETDDKVGNGHLFIWKLIKQASPATSTVGITPMPDQKHPPLNSDLNLGGVDKLRELYLDLLKRSLYNIPYGDLPFLEALFSGRQSHDFKTVVDHIGHTMVGMSALTDLRTAFENVLRDNVPGDLVETGVWRGGTTIYMRGLLRAHHVKDRRVWVVDSFAGVPPPDTTKYPQDAGIDLHVFPDLAVSLEQVRLNFARYGLLDDQVRFLKGWFRDTLPAAPIEKIAILRLDGDLYESTMDALTSLYPKLAVGGYVFIDDYGAIEACRKAVADYRFRFGIEDPIVVTDATVVYWKRSETGPHFAGTIPLLSPELAAWSQLGFSPADNDSSMSPESALINLGQMLNVPPDSRWNLQQI